MVPENHLEDVNECPDCASQNIVHGMMRDQIICRDCGSIFEPLAPAQKSVPKKVVKPAKKAKTKSKPKKKAKPKKAKKKAKKSSKKKRR